MGVSSRLSHLCRRLASQQCALAYPGQFPGSLPFAQQTRLLQPLPQGSLGNCVPPRDPTAASVCGQDPTAATVRSASWKALMWRGGEKAFVAATDLLKS